MTTQTPKTTPEKEKSSPTNMTCYDAIEESSCNCMRKTCKLWINHEEGKNCMMVTTKMGPLTLNEVGKIYGLTRMRICQIEKNIYQKIRNFVTQ